MAADRQARRPQESVGRRRRPDAPPSQRPLSERAATRSAGLHRTRIAVKVLFDYLEDGQSVDDFVKHYPSVSREQAIAALDEVEGLLEATA